VRNGSLEYKVEYILVVRLGTINSGTTERSTGCQWFNQVCGVDGTSGLHSVIVGLTAKTDKCPYPSFLARRGAPERCRFSGRDKGVLERVQTTTANCKDTTTLHRSRHKGWHRCRSAKLCHLWSRYETASASAPDGKGHHTFDTRSVVRPRLSCASGGVTTLSAECPLQLNCS
jgi:hypothetical protein